MDKLWPNHTPQGGQFTQRRLARDLHRLHIETAALPAVAVIACGDDVGPRGVATVRAGNDVVERQLLLLATVLTPKAVTQEDVPAREWHPSVFRDELP